MASIAEQQLSRELRAILAGLATGATIEYSDQFQKVLDALEFFLPGVLGDDWHDGFDGFYPVLARKTKEREAEIFGLCILIADQALTPIHLRIQLAVTIDHVSWLQCSVGEMGDQGMIRTPYAALDAALNRGYRLCYLDGAMETIEWAHTVTVGQTPG